MSEFDELLQSLVIERFKPAPPKNPHDHEAADHARNELLDQLDRERARRNRHPQGIDSEGTDS